MQLVIAGGACAGSLGVLGWGRQQGTRLMWWVALAGGLMLGWAHSHHGLERAAPAALQVEAQQLEAGQVLLVHLTEDDAPGKSERRELS